jgi:hypothetical protein
MLRGTSLRASGVKTLEFEMLFATIEHPAEEALLRHSEQSPRSAICALRALRRVEVRFSVARFFCAVNRFFLGFPPKRDSSLRPE